MVFIIISFWKGGELDYFASIFQWKSIVSQRQEIIRQGPRVETKN